ncbi:hypothetical protein E1281_19985 [Actinomadura sp. KC345]|uniref:hypothetical protein n=1 Tax=Actinomadura sp. KC345 TaxID=2530371 RepID=UPI00104AE2F5|nr:hypothetical protein [Actinomadura sp. KC345]TDC51694.1 hypothetical protein E1281_19985 [Actinomadura sp. KC345]
MSQLAVDGAVGPGPAAHSVRHVLPPEAGFLTRMLFGCAALQTAAVTLAIPAAPPSGRDGTPPPAKETTRSMT